MSAASVVSYQYVPFAGSVIGSVVFASYVNSSQFVPIKSAFGSEKTLVNALVIPASASGVPDVSRITKLPPLACEILTAPLASTAADTSVIPAAATAATKSVAPVPPNVTVVPPIVNVSELVKPGDVVEPITCVAVFLARRYGFNVNASTSLTS